MHVRFIELMPLNGDTDGSRFRSLFISGREILDRAQEELGDLNRSRKTTPPPPPTSSASTAPPARSA